VKQSFKRGVFLLKDHTSIEGYGAMLPCQIFSLQINYISSSVSFDGWRLANTKFKFWTIKWQLCTIPFRKAGIFEVVMTSTYKIH